MSTNIRKGITDHLGTWIIPDWPAPPSVHAVTTTREAPGTSPQSLFGFNIGSRCGDEPARVVGNRDLLREALSMPSEPHWLRQVHGTRVAIQPQGEPEADAAVSPTPGTVLAIQTADCLPVLFCAHDGSEIGAAHAGWRGLSAGVLENTLAAMQGPHENIIAWLGPAIAAPSYEIGAEVRDAFLAHDPAAASAFTATRPGHWLCDLYALACQRLRTAGLNYIFGGGFDTFTDPRLHSYRRDGANSGRMVSLIWMLPKAN
ncbi:MAG TPA: peptidoglycan editing factor PgeF [Rhodanobacteraceae bacterium]|nr:peptidoglycan editing factor PgeF [Rhodanobacteraceae bacterium]